MEKFYTAIARYCDIHKKKNVYYLSMDISDIFSISIREAYDFTLAYRED